MNGSVPKSSAGYDSPRCVGARTGAWSIHCSSAFISCSTTRERDEASCCSPARATCPAPSRAERCGRGAVRRRYARARRSARCKSAPCSMSRIIWLRAISSATPTGGLKSRARFAAGAGRTRQAQGRQEPGAGASARLAALVCAVRAPRRQPRAGTAPSARRSPSVRKALIASLSLEMRALRLARARARPSAPLPAAAFAGG